MGLVKNKLVGLEENTFSQLRSLERLGLSKNIFSFLVSPKELLIRSPYLVEVVIDDSQQFRFGESFWEPIKNILVVEQIPNGEKNGRLFAANDAKKLKNLMKFTGAPALARSDSAKEREALQSKEAEEAAKKAGEELLADEAKSEKGKKSKGGRASPKSK